MRTVRTQIEKNEMDKRITCKWEPELDNQYLSSFNMRNIQNFQQQLAAIIYNMSHATQELTDHVLLLLSLLRTHLVQINTHMRRTKY